ncbi:hypothetical protein WA158_002713 [Blastocystis sp. Blastoise]
MATQQASISDMYTPVRKYIENMINSLPDSKALRVLILDEETMNNVSVVFTQSQILEKNVCLTEKLGSKHENMRHLEAVVYIRATPKNIKLLCEEIKSPKYKAYNIFFSNFITQDMLSSIAECDSDGVVKQVCEYYDDYILADKDHFTINLDNSLCLCKGGNRSNEEDSMMHRSIDAILGALLTLKQKPTIRYQASSSIASTVAKEIDRQINLQSKTTIFDYKQYSCTLLILDRSFDPVTPLLTQLRYQSMLHEFLGVLNNRVIVRENGEIKNEYSVSPFEDDFFVAHKWDDYGTLCGEAKKLADSYSVERKQNSNIQSIEDMQRFIETFKSYKTLETSAGKHVSLVADLGDRWKRFNLTPVVTLEQSLANTSNYNEQYQQLTALIQDQKVNGADALRLVILYALRYGNSKGNLSALTSMLIKKGVTSEQCAIVEKVMKFKALSKSESEDSNSLFKFKSDAFSGVFSNLVQGFKDMAMELDRYNPPLKSMIQQAQKGKLNDKLYPYFNLSNNTTSDIVIVYIIGGTTYKEGQVVHDLNMEGTPCVVGGTQILNSSSFLEGINSMY